jgi:hypothetical protein
MLGLDPQPHLIIGSYGSALGPSAIGTLVERVTKFLILVHLPDGYKASQLRDALIAQTPSSKPGARP